MAILVPAGAAIGAGGGLYVFISSVKNPPAAAGLDINVSTTGNTAQAIGPYTITGATAVSGVSLAATNPAPTTGGGTATYPVLFTTATGLTTGVDTITLTGPVGTVFALTPGDYAVKLVGFGTTTVIATPTQTALNNVTIVVPATYAAGAMEVLATGVTNPTTAGTTYSISVSTSLDSVAGTSGSYTITAPTAVGTVMVVPSTTTAGMPATYTVSFVPDLALTGATTTVTLTGPVGTVFPTAMGNYTVSDNGALAVALAAATSHSTSADITITLPNSILAGHTVTVLVTGVTNPGAGATTLAVRASVDTGAGIGFYTITSAGGVVVSPVTTPIADALAAGAAVAHLDGVVLLTDGTTLPADVQAYLTAHPGKVYAIGGPAVAADPAATAISGTDRYATATALAAAVFTAPTTLGVAGGVAFPDALSGGAFEAHANAPLLLSTPAALSPTTGAYLTDNMSSVVTTNIFGGDAALSTTVQAGIGTALGL